MKYIYLLVLFCLSCSANTYIYPNDHKVQVRDGISKQEAEKVFQFVREWLAQPGKDYKTADVELKDLVSISNWDTPGMPTEEDKKCVYSANFSYGVFGRELCIGIVNGSYNVLSEATWFK